MKLLIEFRFAVDEVGDHLHIAVRVSPEREAGVYREFLPGECRCHGDELRLAVVEHLLQVAALFKSFTVDAPFLFEACPVDFALVDGRVFHILVRSLGIVGGYRLSGLFRRCCGLLRLLNFLLRRRKLHLVVFEHLGICHRVFGEVADYCAYRIVAVSGDAEESEGRRVLALPDKVRQECLDRVLTLLEFHEVREFRRLYIGHLWCAVLVESGHCAYLPGLVVAGDKHFFLIQVFCHNKKVFGVRNLRRFRRDNYCV